MIADMVASASQTEILSAAPEALARLIGGSGRAGQVWGLLRRGEDPLCCAELGKKARSALRQSLVFTAPKLIEQHEAACGTRKWLVELDDGARIESVLIPGERRTTLCVSTQVGCARACPFCATGSMGLVRNLSAAEIVVQLWLALREQRLRAGPSVSNLVLMGMGEPLDNFEAVAQAVALLCHPRAFAMAPRRMTLSTIGPSPKAIARCADLPVNLAWSLHAASDGLRARLIPQLRYRNAELRDAFAGALQGPRARLFVEMALIAELNDGLAQADELMELFVAMREQVRVNLLPVNAGAGNFEPSPVARVLAFKKHLQDHGFFCEIRKARGPDIQAACGQLAAGL